MSDTTFNNHIIVVDVPTEAGTHWPGQTKAPQALRDAGLVNKLKSIGYTVSSLRALDGPQHWRPTELLNGVRDEENTLKVMKQVAGVLERDASKGIQLILGGDCSITPGILAGVNKAYRGERIGLVYFDGDADLTLPSEGGAGGHTGILDSMVLTHLTQRPGGLQSMRNFCKSDGSPLVTNENIVLFGFDPAQLLAEHWTFLAESQFKIITRPTVSEEPRARAEEALRWLESRVDKVLIHFDVDVIDSGMFPLANYPHYEGLRFREAMDVMEVLVQSRKLAGLVITEVNPNNDPYGLMVKALVDGLVKAFEARHRPG